MNKKISISVLLSKSKSYFFKLFVYISISIVTLISITSFTITNSNTDQLLKTVNIANQKLLSNSAYNFDYLNDYISSLIVTLYMNNSANILMYSKNPDLFSIKTSFDNLNNSLYNLPFVQSVYIYSAASENYYCISGYPVVRSTNAMYDREIVKIVNEHTVKISKPFPRVIPFSAYEPQKKVNVYSYILYNFDSSTGMTTDAIIVNVEAKWLMGNIILQGKGMEGNSTAIIANNDGLVYARNNEAMFMSSISKSDYFNEVMNANNTSGYFTKKVEGVESIVTYIRLDSSELVFISITSLKEVYTRINDVLRITITISIILLLISLILSYFISRKFYIPINNLRKNMYSMIGLNTDENKKADEFSVMNSMFTRAAKKITYLENFADDNICALKNQYLLNLLTSGSSSDDKVVLKAEQLHILVNINKPMILVVFMQDYYKETENHLKEIKTEAADIQFINIILSSFEKADFLGEVVKTAPGCFTAILNPEKASLSYDDLMDTLKFSIEIIQNEAISRLAKRYSISISRIFPKLSNMRQVYAEALEVLQYKFIEGSGCILTSEYINEIRSENLVFPYKQASELIEALKAKRLDTAMQVHKNISAYLSEFSLENIKYGLLYLSMMVFDMINVIENNSNFTFEIQHPQFNKQINALETLQEINNAFEALYMQIVDKLHHKNNPKTDTLIEDIKAYVEAHFMDSNLSLISIADKFGYSPAYLGKIFNIASEVSVASFINEVRLNKASSLLRETHYTIEAILQTVGWESKKYFFTVFKKRYGVTPNEYRFSK